jgi:topoisomerase-4 subunit A
LDGKAKTHYLKRFVFENTTLGKKTSIISEEVGSQLFFISGYSKPKIKLEVLKGKSKISEVSEIELADAIEVKGMKAMGNKLSPHEVKNIEILQSLIAEDEENLAHGDTEKEPDDQDVLAPPSDDLIDVQNNNITEVQLDSSKEPETASDAISNEMDAIPEVVPEVQLESAKEPEKPTKKVDFEITNPDDLDIDNQGQLGLF